MNSIQAQLDLLAQTRKNVLAVIDSCTVPQLNKIPKNFNNNILWNAAHLVATMDILIYSSSGTASGIDPDLTANYKKGTSPQGDKDQAFVEHVKSLLYTSLEQLRKDYESNAFGPYAERVTSYGVKLTSVVKAICFNNLHESMHLGQIKMLHRLV